MTNYKIRISDLRTLFAEVKDICGIDFSNYAYFTIKRRVEKILQTYNYVNVDEFIEKLKNDERFFETFIFEMHPLQSELFRDSEMWNSLIKNVFPKFSRKDKIKIYVPHCTSGDELYSLIILLEENDLIENSIITASPVGKRNKTYIENAIYPIKKKESAEKNLETLTTKKTINDLILFSNHSYEIKEKYKKNIIFDDKPFLDSSYVSEFDIVLFRNSLIYFNSQMHEAALNKIATTLKRNGYLIIGVGEKLIGETEKKFKQILKTENIFKKG